VKGILSDKEDFVAEKLFLSDYKSDNEAPISEKIN
jgi:hypothetical protein